jgi:hypothetical protein
VVARTGNQVLLEIDAGSYSPFEVLGSERASTRAGPGVAPHGARSWRLAARTPGTVRIDTSRAPVRVRGLGPGSSLELAGLVLDSHGSPEPALVIEDCAGTVFLDGVSVAGEVKLERANAVLVQGCGLGSLALVRSSRAEASSSAISAAALAGGSLLETWGIDLAPAIEPGSCWIGHGERRPRLEWSAAASPELDPAFDPKVELRVKSDAETIWWLFATTELDRLESTRTCGPIGRRSSVFHAAAGLRVPWIAGPSRGDVSEFGPILGPWSADGALYLRALVYDPARHELVFSEIHRTR